MNLIFRIPGQNKVKLKGQFKELNAHDTLDGFIVSNFDGSSRFGFKVGDIDTHPSVTHSTPIEIDKFDYVDSISRLKFLMSELGLIKVVISRTKSQKFDPENVAALFDILCNNHPKALVYWFNDPFLGQWIGATPEILLKQIHNQCFTMSLAGTMRQDEIRTWTKKEKREQSLVTEFIVNQLDDLGISNVEIMGPYDYVAGPVKHLRTDLQFEADQKMALDIITKLHPTPAVCGLPREMASETFMQLEKHDREIYTGIIGWFTSDVISCYVNIRCGKILNNHIHAFVGGGITSDSVAIDEWDETENKSKTLLELLKFS